MTRPGRISVVLPVYRNRGCLPELHERLTRALGALTGDYELVFVDDCGGDGSLEWLRECSQRDAHTVVIEQAQNGGQHRAVLAGLAYSRGDVVVSMDADLQDPPEAIESLVRTQQATGGIVFARRTSRHQSLGRHVTGWLFKHLLQRLAGSRIPAGTGMFFAAPRADVDAAVALAGSSPYVRLLFDAAGSRMTAVDVVKSFRVDSRSAYTAGRRLKLAKDAIRQALAMRRARRPVSRASALRARKR